MGTIPELSEQVSGFTIPTVVNGRVYVEAKGKVDVCGLLAIR
jgi:hypothetical protein